MGGTVNVQQTHLARWFLTVIAPTYTDERIRAFCTPLPGGLRAVTVRRSGCDYWRLILSPDPDLDLRTLLLILLHELAHIVLHVGCEAEAACQRWAQRHLGYWARQLPV